MRSPRFAKNNLNRRGRDFMVGYLLETVREFDTSGVWGSVVKAVRRSLGQAPSGSEGRVNRPRTGAFRIGRQGKQASKRRLPDRKAMQAGLEWPPSGSEGGANGPRKDAWKRGGRRLKRLSSGGYGFLPRKAAPHTDYTDHKRIICDFSCFRRISLLSFHRILRAMDKRRRFI
jgi:hypothetical protein